MSVDKQVGAIVRDASARATNNERQRCADIAQFYPLDGFAYNGDTGELLRLRDDISQAILKGSRIGEMIK